MDHQDTEIIQQRIGYRFQNTDLLQQAFVRRSYSQEMGGENNEVLEFIGDKVLDLVVVKLLTQTYGHMTGADGNFIEFACEKDESELTQIKKQLVQKKNLADRVRLMGLHDYLILGEGDNSWDSPSVQEDLLEAILGAAAIDSGWDLDRLETLTQIMLGIDVPEEAPEEDWVALVQDWTAKKGIGTPAYHFREAGMQSAFWDGFSGVSQEPELAETAVRFHCLLKIREDLPPFRGFGASKVEARRNACAVAYEYLEEKGHLFSIRDEIPNPNREEAISQLEILARRGYFSIPHYAFDQTYDKNGNPIWRCRCSIREKNTQTDACSTSKKDAKKQAAWEMLSRILEK